MSLREDEEVEEEGEGAEEEEVEEEKEDDEDTAPKLGGVPFFHGKKQRGKSLKWVPSKEFGPFCAIKKHPAKHPNKELRNTVDINASRLATVEQAKAFFEPSQVTRAIVHGNVFHHSSFCVQPAPRKQPAHLHLGQQGIAWEADELQVHLQMHGEEVHEAVSSGHPTFLRGTRGRDHQDRHLVERP